MIQRCILVGNGAQKLNQNLFSIRSTCQRRAYLLGKTMLQESTSTQKMRMVERNTLRIKSELYDTELLSYGRNQVPLLEDSISPWKTMLLESTSTQKMRMVERNTLRIKSELYDTAPLSYGRHQVNLLEESISPWKNHVIGFHIYSKNAYGREEHAPHKIIAL